jgi:nucleotidyltransferase/DNA polymerase involved in DNA repair
MNRIILHIDVNNAFLSWTAVDMLRNGYKYDIRNRYAIIGGDESQRRGIVLAKSNLCKKRGVVTAEAIYSARRKCPYLEVYKPNYKFYKYCSDKMYEYLCTYTDIIERYSIDECFLDYTNSASLFGDPVKVAYKIKDDIYRMFGFTVNVGIDNSPVYYEREEAKSISSSTVLPYNYHDINMINDVIMNLSMDVGKKLRNNNKYADTVGIWFKYNYFDKFSRQEKLDVSISTDEEIYRVASRIFNGIWNHDDGIRSICVFISGFSNERKKQLSIFDVSSDDYYDIKRDDKLQSVIDDIRDKYGNNVISFNSINIFSKNDKTTTF